MLKSDFNYFLFELGLSVLKPVLNFLSKILLLIFLLLLFLLHDIGILKTFSFFILLGELLFFVITYFTCLFLSIVLKFPWDWYSFKPIDLFIDVSFILTKLLLALLFSNKIFGDTIF